MNRLVRFDETGMTHFITFSCYRHLALLTNDLDVYIFLEELERTRRTHDLSLLGYVVMPDHIHLVIHAENATPLSIIIGYAKSRSAFRIISRWKSAHIPLLSTLCVLRDNRPKHAFWQRRCYDHNCRNANTVREKIRYCHMNPVKAGLVSSPQDWRWSSYRWYEGLHDNLVQIDESILSV